MAMVENGATNILPVKHTSYVLQRLNDQRRKGTFCDAILIVEGEKFPVHRSFLAANSDYFLSLFSSAEEQQNFVLAGVPIQGFRVILDFIYTSTFVLNLSNVHDVHKASSALNFTHVQTACEKVYHKIKQMKEASVSLNADRRPISCKGTEYPLKRDQNGEASLLQANPLPGRGVRAPAPYLRRLSSNRTLSDDSDTASSKDAELTSVSSSSPSDDFIKSGFHEENDRVEQASAIDLKRKIKKEVLSSPFPSPEESPSKRSKAMQPQTITAEKATSEESHETEEKSSHTTKPETLLSVYFEKADYFESEKSLDVKNLTAGLVSDSNLNATKSLKKVPEKKSCQKEQQKILNRCSSDSQVTGKGCPFSEENNNGSKDGDQKTDKQDYLYPFKTGLSDINKSSYSKCKADSEAVFSKWKLVPVLKKELETSTNYDSSENPAKVHRSRRKMLKTNKVCTNSAE